MISKKTRSTGQQKQLEDMHRRFLAELAKQPTISDADFMAEFEVGDEQYAKGLVLPGVGNQQGGIDE